jgi:hypothetical protein
MLKFLRFAAVVSVVLLTSITACSSTKLPQNTSSASDLAQSNSSDATPEIALAIHLRQMGAKFYGAYWCSYCHKQKDLFGKEAVSQLDYVECDPAGKNSRAALCQKANIKGFPTWEINGKQYEGFQSLQHLAELSGYRGDRNFRN